MAEPWPEEKYGGFWIRFLAYLIDSLIVGIGFVALVMLLGMMGLELFSPELILLVVSILYWAGMHASGRQATYGKALLGLRVTGTIGDRISFVKALVRELAKILSTLTFLIGYILAGVTKRKQALHDFIASTQVVRTEPGHVVAGVAVAILALCAPVIAVTFFGVGFVAGALGELASTISIPPDIVVQAPPKPAAPAPKPKVVQAPPAAPKPAAPIEPKVVVAAPAPAPAPAKAVEAPPAKPIPTAAPAPVVLAQASEPAKPIVVQSAEPKPAKKPRAAKAPAEPKPEALPKEAAAPAPEAKVEPKPEPKPEPAPTLVRDEPVAEPVPVATGPGPKFNDLMTAVIYQDTKTVEQLLAYGKWPDKPDSRGVTPLMVAAMLGDGPIAESLLKAGANPNAPGPGGDTATSIARQRSDAAMLGLLKRHGGR